MTEGAKKKSGRTLFALGLGYLIDQGIWCKPGIDRFDGNAEKYSSNCQCTFLGVHC